MYDLDEVSNEITIDFNFGIDFEGSVLDSYCSNPTRTNSKRKNHTPVRSASIATRKKENILNLLLIVVNQTVDVI